MPYYQGIPKTSPSFSLIFPPVWLWKAIFICLNCVFATKVTSPCSKALSPNNHLPAFFRNRQILHSHNAPFLDDSRHPSAYAQFLVLKRYGNVRSPFTSCLLARRSGTILAAESIFTCTTSLLPKGAPKGLYIAKVIFFILGNIKTRPPSSRIFNNRSIHGYKIKGYPVWPVPLK